MNNLYIFIIWSKVYWSKKRILNDLRKSFNVVNCVDIKWNKENYGDNILALYGTKIANIKEKLDIIGSGVFSLILVEDKNPVFEKRMIFDTNELVDINVYNKKQLYRKWTGTNFRIHCSDNNAETKHDCVILFGSDYLDIIKNNNSYNFDTKGVNGFDSVDDFIDCMNLFGSNRLMVLDYELTIFAKSKIDVLRFINKFEIINNNMYKLRIKDKEYILYIFGVKEGEISFDMYEKTDIDSFANIKKDYLDFVINGQVSNRLNSYFNEKCINYTVEKKEAIRKYEKKTIIETTKKEIKYILALARCIIYNIFEK